jgi:ribonucleoside-diphosphate reductase alpha chain
MDGTNVSVRLNDEFFEAYNDPKNAQHTMAHQVYWATVRQMLKTGEPGFSIDTGKNSACVLRNACTEVTSADDSDICNLGSINMARITSEDDMKACTEVLTALLVAGTVYSDVPYSKVDEIRTKNRLLGVGVMGIHEWLLLNGKKYGPDADLAKYMDIYTTTGSHAHHYEKQWGLSKSKRTRAIAPCGTIGIVAETSTSLEPILCAAYKRRYLKGNTWNYQYVIEPIAKRLIEEHGVNPDNIEDAYSLAEMPEKRVEFQVWMQQYVDHSISSTINLPPWGSEGNNDTKVQEFGDMLIKYLPNLRGITCYPDGARSGQPISAVSYKTAIKHVGEILIENGDICELSKSGGTCGS